MLGCMPADALWPIPRHKILKSAEKIELRYDGTYARPNRLYRRGDTETMTETDFCSFITSPKLLELI